MACFLYIQGRDDILCGMNPALRRSAETRYEDEEIFKI